MDDDFYFFNEFEDALDPTDMGEPEAYKALEEGYIRVDGKVYNMEKQPQGWCDGCCFYNMDVCPSIAKKVCCTGGVIFHERK